MKHFYIELKYLLFLIFGCLIYACTSSEQTYQPPTDALFKKLEADQTGIDFSNQVLESDSFNIMTYRNYYNGGGVAIGDINNDGLQDVYFTSNMEENRLYLNKGNWQFEEITATAGVQGNTAWSTGVTMADINADGWLDIYVCNSGDLTGDSKRNELYINNGDLTFSEQAEAYGLASESLSTHASFFDYDLDGDLDCYLLNNSFKSIDKVEQFTMERDKRINDGDKLFRNDNGRFVDVSESAGIYGSYIGFGLGVSVSDLNGDMYPDIYISNDFWERDYLYINQKDGTFKDELITRTSSVSASSMGADVADLNNDGSVEIFTTEMLPSDNYRLKTMANFEETNVKELKVRSSYHYQLMQNCLQYNDGEGNFQERALQAEIAATDWSWGALMFDMNNDGWKDIFISNGIYHDITSMDFSDFVNDRENIRKIVEETGKFDFYDMLEYIPSTKLANAAFLNEEGISFQNAATVLGLDEPSFSNGAAYGDLDNDGDLDLIVNNIGAQAFVYENQTNHNTEKHYLTFQFEGSGKNTFGIGAQVRLFAKGKMQVQQNYQSRGFQSAVAPQLLFGLGGIAVVDSIQVIWPDLRMEVLKKVPANQTLIVSQRNAQEVFTMKKKTYSPLYVEASQLVNGNKTHVENNFNDFDHERLAIRKVSTEGPKILTGDLNMDGIEDFILLGAFGDSDKVFFQKKDGSYQPSFQMDIAADSIFESTCGIIADLDGDGDNDILIGSAGNEFQKGLLAYRLRYYENDGKGDFIVSPRRPEAIGNFSVIVGEDYDLDGDIDLFIGGRVVPGNYGLTPRSFLFRNDGEYWTNVANESLSGLGMVTDAVWSDFNKDNKKDLVVVGDWMPITVFLNQNDSIGGASGLADTEGWWQTIEAVDLDDDGYDDYVLGNWGLNTKFKASKEQPLSMYVKDFDGNGKSDIVVNWYPPAEKTAYPFASKKDMTSQMPLLKKKAFTFGEYAAMTYEALFTTEQRKDAIAYTAKFLETAVLRNCSDEISLEALPMQAQVAPVNAILVDDFNEDGLKDLYLFGNFYGLKPETGRHDANHGVLLVGDTEGNFNFVSNSQTGIYVNGEVRDAAVLTNSSGKKTLLITPNNQKALVYQGK